MKDELVGKIMIKFVGLKVKTYSYLVADGREDEKSKIHKKVCQKRNNLNLKVIKTVQKQLNLRMK